MAAAGHHERVVIRESGDGPGGGRRRGRRLTGQLGRSLALPGLRVVFGAAALLAPALAPAEGVRVLGDLPFLPAGRAERLDLYLPQGGSGAALRPAVVYFHGGGWYKGDKATPREKEIGRALAAAGYVFVSANYRLGWKAWPTNLEDCENAVRFLRSHAAQYRVDPSRIAAMGASAGGHLALLVAYENGRDAGPASGSYAGVPCSVRAVIDLYGITDLLTRCNVKPDGTPLCTLDDAHSEEMLGISRAKGSALWAEASPVNHIGPDAPPTLIFHGLSDAIVDYGQAIELANDLRAKHIPHKLVLIEGVGHEFDLQDTFRNGPLPFDLRPLVLQFLRETIGG